MPFGGLLIAGGIAAGGRLIGSLFGARGAKKAARTQAEMGLKVGQSIDKSTGQAIDLGYQGIAQANNALNAGQTGATNAYVQNAGAANEKLQGGYEEAQGLLAPYQQAGGQGLEQLQAFMAPGGPGSTPFTADMMAQYDPGYQFRMKEGLRGVESGAAARGSVLGGAAQKQLARYSQDYASGEYQNAFNRHLNQNAQQYNMLSGLAGFGERANTQGIQAGEFYTGNQGRNFMEVGHNVGNANLQTGNALANVAMQGNQWIGNTGLQGAMAAGNAYTGAANATAAGQAGSANAWAQGINDASRIPFDAYMMNKYGPQGQVQGDPGNPYGADPTAGMWGIPQAPAPPVAPPPPLIPYVGDEPWTQQGG